ncbi:MAG: hypothetical protein QM831_40650 [Kofleriaceae bacterium]
MTGQEIIEKLKAGSADAFPEFRRAFGWPHGKGLQRVPTGELVDWVRALRELADARNAAQLVGLADAVISDPDSPDRLYDLGFALIDAGTPDFAATILWRCLGLVGDSEEVVCELVSALETAMAYEDAYQILRERPALREKSFLCQYLFAFDSAMTGRIDDVRDTVVDLHPETPEHQIMFGTIARMLERCDRISGITKLDDYDLRGWHYLLTGGILLQRSPWGLPDPMRGRYAYLEDSKGHVASSLDRVIPLVRGMPCVYALDGRDNEIVAHAAATLLEIPVAPWPTIGVPAPGLIVAYQLDSVPRSTLQILQTRKPDQVFYAHASNWTHDFPVAPDITTYLYQAIKSDWADDPRTPEEIAADIVAASRFGADMWGDDEWKQLVDTVWPLEPGPRTRLWAGGPVPSNRFV